MTVGIHGTLQKAIMGKAEITLYQPPKIIQEKIVNVKDHRTPNNNNTTKKMVTTMVVVVEMVCIRMHTITPLLQGSAMDIMIVGTLQPLDPGLVGMKISNNNNNSNNNKTGQKNRIKNNQINV